MWFSWHSELIVVMTICLGSCCDLLFAHWYDIVILIDNSFPALAGYGLHVLSSFTAFDGLLHQPLCFRAALLHRLEYLFTVHVRLLWLPQRKVILLMIWILLLSAISGWREIGITTHLISCHLSCLLSVLIRWSAGGIVAALNHIFHSQRLWLMSFPMCLLLLGSIACPTGYLLSQA